MKRQFLAGLTAALACTALSGVQAAEGTVEVSPYTARTFVPVNKATGNALQAALSYYAQVRDNEIIITGSAGALPSDKTFKLMVWEQTCMPMTCSFGE